jgi:hypothetical protein
MQIESLCGNHLNGRVTFHVVNQFCRYSDKTRISHFHENRVNNIFIFYHGQTTHRP